MIAYNNTVEFYKCNKDTKIGGVYITQEIQCGNLVSMLYNTPSVLILVTYALRMSMIVGFCVYLNHVCLVSLYRDVNDKKIFPLETDINFVGSDSR